MNSLIAEKIARESHKNQKRWGGEPYIIHPEYVAKKVSHLGEEYEIVAWLHDTVEDSLITYHFLISEGFSETVIKAIKSITKDKNELYDDYIKRVQKNKIATAVKIEDIKHNLSTSTDEQAKNKRIIYRLSLSILRKDGHEALWEIPCSGDGPHDSFWKSVVTSPQWKAWMKNGSKLWDIDECYECGWISQGHLQAFLSFLKNEVLKEYLVESTKREQCYYCHEDTNPVAGNPSEWPLHFCHKDDPGKVKAHHVKCVTLRLHE